MRTGITRYASASRTYRPRSTTASKGGSEALGEALAKLEALIGERDQAVREAASGHISLVVAHEQAIAAEEVAETLAAR
jgi:hypothetical protein